MSRKRAEVVAFVNRLAERYGMSLVFRTARKDLVRSERDKVAKMLRVHRFYRNHIVHVRSKGADERYECALKNGRFYHVSTPWAIDQDDPRIRRVTRARY